MARVLWRRGELSGRREMGGRSWRGHFYEGSPTLGNKAEPVVYPVGVGAARPLARGELCRVAKGRVTFDKKSLTNNPKSFGRKLLHGWAKVG